MAVPLDPIKDRPWMRGNGLGIVMGEEVFQQAILDFIQEEETKQQDQVGRTRTGPIDEQARTA